MNLDEECRLQLEVQGLREGKNIKLHNNHNTINTINSINSINTINTVVYVSSS